MTRIDRTIDSIVGMAEGLNPKLANARAIILAQLAICGEPKAHPTDTTPRGQAELTPTETAAHQADYLIRQLNDLGDNLDAVVKILRNLHADTDRILAHRHEVPRCDGGVGREGYMIPLADGGWSHLDCWNVPAPGRKTCDACRQRAHRWARQREDAVA